MFSRLQRRRGNLQDLGRLSKSCPAVDHEAGEEDDSEETSSSESWGSTASLSDPFAESGEEVAPSVSRAEKQLARRSLRQAKKREVQQKRNMEQNKISMDDYLGKQAHFRLWLQEEQKKQAKDLSSPKRKTYFKMFVRLWNKRHLPAKYYETRLSWHAEGEAASPTEKRSPSAPERGRFSLLQNSPAMDPSLFPHTIDLSSDSIALPTTSPSSFSTFGKSTPLSSLLPFKFPGSGSKKALSEHMVTPRSADQGMFRFGEDNKENTAHLSLPATLAKTEHLRTATISPRKKMMSTCQGRSLDRVSVSWSPQGQLKLNPVETPRCPSPFTAHPPSTTNTTATPPTSKEEVSRHGPASGSAPVSGVYHQVKDVLTSGGSPEYADVTAFSGQEDGAVMSLPPVQVTTKSQGHRRRSRSVEETPVYAVPSRQLRDRAWSEKTRPLSEEGGGSVSPPPVPPKRFDPHVEGLGIPFSPPVLAPKGNANAREKGGDGGASGGKDNAKKSGKTFKFSWFGKKLTSRRRSRSCEALSPAVQPAGDPSQAGDGLFPLVQLERSPTLGRRVLTRPHKPPGKQTDASPKKLTLNSSSLPQATKKKAEVSHMNQQDVTQHPSSLAREGAPPARNKPPNKLKFELTEYSSSPMRLGCGNKMVTFSGPEETRSKRGNGLRRRSHSLENIPSEGQDRSLTLIGMREQVPEEPVGRELYEEVKSEVRSELSDLVNKLKQRSSADVSQTPHQQYTTTSVKELKSSPKRLGRREKPEEASSSEAMNLHLPHPEVKSAGKERANDLQVPMADVANGAEEGRGSPNVPGSISSESHQGMEESLQVCSVTDSDVLMKDATEQSAVTTDSDHHLEMQWTQIAEEISKQMSEGTAELQRAYGMEGFSQQNNRKEGKLHSAHNNPEGAPRQESKADTVDWQNSQSRSENEISEEMAAVLCTEKVKESPCRESSREEKGAVKLADTDDKLAPPCRAEQTCVAESPFESCEKLTDSINNTQHTDSGLSMYTDRGSNEGLSASHAFLPNESSSQKDVEPPKSLICETNQILPPSTLVCETPSQKEKVCPPSHHEEVAFSVTLPTAQHITDVSKPLTPKKRGPQRRRSRSVDMTMSGMGCVQTPKVQVHASSFQQPVDGDIPAPKTAAKTSDAEEKRRNETHTPGILGLVTQACKQPPPVPPKTLKTPVFTDRKAMSALTATPHTLPKPPASLNTQQAVTGHEAAPAATENAAVSTFTAVQHGGPSRSTTHSRNRRRSRSVGDMAAMEESEVHPGEGGGFASVRAFWNSMRGRGGQEKGSGVSLQRKPSTMRRLQQQLFGTQQAEGGKESASDLPPPPVTSQNMNVVQSTPSTQQAQEGRESASDLPPPPVTPQNMNMDQSTPSRDLTKICGAVMKLPQLPDERSMEFVRDTSTVNDQAKMHSQENKAHQPIMPVEESKTVCKLDAPRETELDRTLDDPASLPPPRKEQEAPSSLDMMKTQCVTGAVSSGEEAGTKTNQHNSPAEARDSPAQGRAGGKEEKACPPFRHSPFVTVRRQSSRKRSMLSESGTPGKDASPQRSLDSPRHEQPGALQEGAYCNTSASLNDGSFSPVCSLPTKSLEESGSSIRANQSVVADVKTTACTVNVEQRKDQPQFVTQSVCSPGSGKRKPQPPRPPPKPAVRPFIKAASQQQSPVTVTGQGVGGVRTRKRRSQELYQTGVADKQAAVGDKADRPVLKTAAYHLHNAVISSDSSSPRNSPSSDKASVDTVMSARVRRVKRRSGDEQEECDLRPVKRRSSGSTNLFPPAVTSGTERTESLKRETTPSPIRQRMNRGGGQQSPAGRGLINRKESASTPARKWSSVQAPSPATGSSSRTSIGSAGHAGSRMTAVGRQDSARKSADNRQSSSRGMVTRQASNRSTTGRRQSGGGNTPARTGSDRRESGGRGTLVKRDSDRRESGGRGTLVKRDSDRRESGGRRTPVKRDSNRRPSGGGGTPTRGDSNRRQSGGRGTPTRRDSGRKDSGGYGMVTRSHSNRALQAGGVTRPQGLTSTPVRTSSLARRRSGMGGASPASKRTSTGNGKSRRDSGSVKRSDSSRGRGGGGEAHRDTPSRNGSFRKQGGLKTPQSPTFMRITRHLGVKEEQSSDVHENHFTVDEEQAQQIIAGLQKAQERACDQDHHDTALIQRSHHHQLRVQDIPAQQAELRKTAHLATGVNKAGDQREVEDMETDIDMWEEDGGLSAVGRGACAAAHLSTLV